MNCNSFPRHITTQTMGRNVYMLLHLFASKHILSSFSHSPTGLVAWSLSKTWENMCLRARPCLKGSSTVEQKNKRRLCWISVFISTNKASSNKKRYQRRQIECSYGTSQTPSQNKELHKNSQPPNDWKTFLLPSQNLCSMLRWATFNPWKRK